MFAEVPSDATGADANWREPLGRVQPGSILLPCSDAALEWLARHRAETVDRGLVSIEADDDVVLAMLDKARTYSLAQSIGIPTPEVLLVGRMADVDDLGDRIPYPCLLKPRVSHALVAATAGTGFRSKLLVVHTPAELRSKLTFLLGLGVEMMICEIIPGDDEQLFSYTSYLAEDGDPLLHFVKQKIRQWPPQYGTGSYHMSVVDPEVAALGLQFFQGIGLRGLAYVEFKRDSRDDALRIIECNHRFGASNELARRAGIDLSVFTYNRLAGRTGPTPATYKAGVRLWHPADDTRAFLRMRRDGELSSGRWLRSLAHPFHVPIFDVLDPVPSVVFHLRAARRWAARRGLPRAPDGVEPPVRRRNSHRAALASAKNFVPDRHHQRVRRWYYSVLPRAQRRAAFADWFRNQANLCRLRDSPLYGSLLDAVASDIEESGVSWSTLEDYVADLTPHYDSPPLRFMAAVHRFVLAGQEPELARYYPSVGGTEPVPEAWPAFRDVVERRGLEIRAQLNRPIQTNEVGRCRAMLGGFLLVARETALPLRILELGASGGLNLRWDHYRYEIGEATWGDPRSSVRLVGGFRTGAPTLDTVVDVVERAGCDLAPLDATTDEGRLTLLSYVWPDDMERVRQIFGAFSIASEIEAPVEQADAAAWLDRRLADPRDGVATVVFHSCVMQYLDDASRRRIERTIKRSGRRARATAPLSYLRLEPSGQTEQVDLTMWPDGTKRILATSDPNGRNIEWLAEA